MAPDADYPTLTLTLTVTRTLWGDLCLDAVTCEGSRLIRPKGDTLGMGGAYFKTGAPGCAYIFFANRSVVKHEYVMKRVRISCHLPAACGVISLTILCR